MKWLSPWTHALLLHTVILPNNPSTSFHMGAVDEYLHKELSAGRMSGPCSCEKTELIMRGPFQSSPLIVAVQPQHPGVPDKLWICRHLSKSTKTHPSVNSHILKDDFPTRFDMASKVAKMVSFYDLFISHHFLVDSCSPLHSADCRFGYLCRGHVT